MSRISEYLYAFGIIVFGGAGLFLLVPQVGDEPYFVQWGLHLAGGYFDHGPLFPWFTWGVNNIESALGLQGHGWGARVSFVLLGLAGFAMMLAYLRRIMPGRQVRASLLAILLLPSVLYMFTVFNIDTFMGIWTLLFVLAVERGVNGAHRWSMAVLAGVGFGLALWTKFTAAPFWIAMVVFLLFSRAGRAFLFGPFILTTAIAAIPLAQILLWGWDHCSVNLAFNFSFRPNVPSLRGAVAYFGWMVLLLGPVLFHVIRNSLVSRPRHDFFTGYFWALLVVTAAVSIIRGVFQPNWGLPYLPVAGLALAEQLRAENVRPLLRRQTVFAMVLLTPLVTVLALDRAGLHPLDRLLPEDTVADMDLELDIGDLSLVEALRPYAEEGRVLATWYYGASARFATQGFPEVTVFYTGPHGRSFDILTDFTALDGRDFVVLSADIDSMLDSARRFFDSVEVIEVAGNRATHRVILGNGFRYADFRPLFVEPVLEGLYDRSPFPYGSCYMDRYRTAE